MAKGSSKSTVLKNAQKVAAATTMDSVARNAGKYDAKNRAKQADSQTADKSASGPKHSKKAEKKMSPARKALVVFAVAMLVVLGCCCVAFAASEESRSQYVPEATMLDGQVDISGMTADELRALLVKRVEGGIATTITLEAGDSSHAIEMGEIGTIDIDATVEQAFAPYRANPVVRAVVTVGELIGMPPAGHDVCTVCVVDHDALVDRVAAVAKRQTRRPRTRAMPTTRRATRSSSRRRPGAWRWTSPPPSRASRRHLPVPTTVTRSACPSRPRRSSPNPSQTIPARASSSTRANAACISTKTAWRSRAIPARPGMSGYATPKGDFTLSYEDPAPIWYNPHSDWSEGMEETIAPGPSNPLGVRALAVSCGGGIFLHGTTNTGGLGSPGSHGCVRLSNSNIVELYDRVSVGIPIIIR